MTMTEQVLRQPEVSRRNFLVGSAAAVGGLSLGFKVPFGNDAAAPGDQKAKARVGLRGMQHQADRCTAVHPRAS